MRIDAQRSDLVTIMLLMMMMIIIIIIIIIVEAVGWTRSKC